MCMHCLYRAAATVDHVGSCCNDGGGSQRRWQQKIPREQRRRAHEGLRTGDRRETGIDDELAGGNSDDKSAAEP